MISAVSLLVQQRIVKFDIPKGEKLLPDRHRHQSVVANTFANAVMAAPASATARGDDRKVEFAERLKLQAATAVSTRSLLAIMGPSAAVHSLQEVHLSARQ
jgi:hypothetical protein